MDVSELLAAYDDPVSFWPDFFQWVQHHGLGGVQVGVAEDDDGMMHLSNWCPRPHRSSYIAQKVPVFLADLESLSSKWCTECESQRTSCDLSLLSLLQLFVVNSPLDGCVAPPAPVLELAEFRSRMWELQSCLSLVAPRLPPQAADLAGQTSSNIERLLSLCVERAGPDLVDPGPLLSRAAGELGVDADETVDDTLVLVGFSTYPSRNQSWSELELTWGVRADSDAAVLLVPLWVLPWVLRVAGRAAPPAAVSLVSSVSLPEARVAARLWTPSVGGAASLAGCVEVAKSL